MTTMISDSSSTAQRLAGTGQQAWAMLTPLLDGPQSRQVWMAAAFLLRAIARDMLGDSGAAERVLQRALDLAELDQALVLDRVPGTVEALIGETADLMAGAGRPDSPTRLLEGLTHGETRVLHYLPTNLSAREIAGELYVSVNTVKTHQRHLYQKLGARTRSQAVEQARASGLLAPSPFRL
jgi:LuxR family transcriptional regulator, maltose regulon positive regulatory protein